MNPLTDELPESEKQRLAGQFAALRRQIDAYEQWLAGVLAGEPVRRSGW